MSYKCDFYKKKFLSKQYFSLKSTRCLPSEQSGAFVRGLFLLVLHLGDARAELHGSLGQDGWLAEAQPPRRQSQQELLADASRKRQIGLLPHGQRVQVAHHLLVQVGKAAGADINQRTAATWVRQQVSKLSHLLLGVEENMKWSFASSIIIFLEHWMRYFPCDRSVNTARVSEALKHLQKHQNYNFN